jgi:2-isopropylmalate synthase
MTTPRSEELTGALQLERWTINSGSNVVSRGAVQIVSGDHRWEATGEGNGPIDALYSAVDRALADVLSGHPRLLSFELRALAEGPDAEGMARVRIAPPAGASGARASGEYSGEGRSTNTVAASIEAYIDALNKLLGEEHWAGATEQAGNRRRVGSADAAGRADFDEEAAGIDTTDWFNRSPR